MGSWLFSSNACNISSCEPWTHPGAHRLVYVRRPSELNAFRKAMKTAAESLHWETTHRLNFQSRPFFSRVRQLFPESAVFGMSRPFLERVA